MLAIFPEIQKIIQEKDIEHLALLVRRYYCQPKPFVPSIDFKKLLEQVGIKVSIVDISEQAALIVKDENGAFAVHALINRKIKNQTEINFLYAHMLGHFLLHVQPQIVSGEWHKGGFKEHALPLQNFLQGAHKNQKNNSELRREEEANAFAAALVLPAAMVAKASTKLPSVDKMMQFFTVSAPLMQKRLFDLGFGKEKAPVPPTPELPQNFLQAEEQVAQMPKTKKTDTTLFSDKATPKPQMPKSFAASSYGKTQKQTEQAAKSADATAPKTATPTTPEQVMSRLRNLAKKIDASVQIK